MAAETKSSKRFLHLFDWNAKSRKKLFTNGLNQEKDLAYDSVESKLSSVRTEVYANENGVIAKRSGTSSSATSVSGDDGYGSRAPGVVAKLMGLESLPISNGCEPTSVSFVDSQNPGGSHDARSDPDIHSRHQIINHSGMSREEDGFSWNSRDSRMSRGSSRSIERFQTEVLPPKTSKPISITHHKLLSPIKSPRFVPTNDAAYIMEAAVRIIDSAERPASIKNSSFGSSSASMRTRDLKDKAEASHASSWPYEVSNKPRQAASRKQIRGDMQGRSNKTTTLFEPSLGSEMHTVGNSNNRGKFISLGLHDTQSLQHLHSREGSASSSNRGSAEKEYKQAKAKQYNSEHSSQKSGHMRSSTNRSSSVLQQNNMKQNSIAHRDRSSSKVSISSQHSRKAASGSSSGPSKLINKAVVSSENGCRKNISATSTAQRRPTLVKMKNISRNKEFVSKNCPADETTYEHTFSSSKERDVERNGSLYNAAEVGRNMDVISFTFTSPIKRSGPPSKSYLEFTENSDDLGLGSHDMNSQHESKGISRRLKLNFVTGDSLSLLLEQKLKELTNRVESVQSDSITEETEVDSSSCLLTSTSRVDSPCRTSVEKNMPSFIEDQNQEDSEVTVEQSSSCSDKDEAVEYLSDTYLQELNMDLFNRNGSCLSPHSSGNEQASSLGSQQVAENMAVDDLHQIEHERGFSDTAISACIEEWNGRHILKANSSTDFRNSSCWELDYVRQIICFAGLPKFCVGENIEFFAANVFDQLEQMIIPTETNLEEQSKVDRKLVFDCVNERISLRCGGICLGSYKAWAKWGTFTQKGDVLAAELCSEFSCLKSMGSLMLDELVDRDMSTWNGRWLDFEIETLEEGTEIVKGIEASLIEELILDIILF